MVVETSWHLSQGMKDVNNEGGPCAKVVEANLSLSLESGPCLTIVAKASFW